MEHGQIVPRIARHNRCRQGSAIGQDHLSAVTPRHVVVCDNRAVGAPDRPRAGSMAIGPDLHHTHPDPLG